MPEVQEVFRMATQKVRPDPGFVDRQHDHHRRRDRNRKIGAFAVAAAIAATAAVAIVTSQPRETTAPAGTPSQTPIDLSALRAARNFSMAIGAFDANTAFGYLAPDADISGLLFGPPEGADGIDEELRLNVMMLEAQGFGQILGPCEQTGSVGSEATVRCGFDFHAIGSDELGLGPFTGSSYDFMVGDDGVITRASVSWEIEDFSPQVWEPFADWVSTRYPEDAAVMYQDETYTGQRLSEESIALWEQRVPGYVVAQTPEMVRIAERFMEARTAYDADAILALLPEDGALVHPMDDNEPAGSSRVMETLRMDLDELALALQAERLFEVRYRSVICRSERDPGWSAAPILCSYELDSRLRQLAGIPPAPHNMRIGVHGGRVDHLAFPWLNVSWPGNVPVEGWEFIEWLQGVHPEVGAPMQAGTLFDYPGGQEMQLILTRESLQLLERYLDEYEAAVVGG